LAELTWANARQLKNNGIAIINRKERDLIGISKWGNCLSSLNANGSGHERTWIKGSLNETLISGPPEYLSRLKFRLRADLNLNNFEIFHRPQPRARVPCGLTFESNQQSAFSHFTLSMPRTLFWRAKDCAG